jgi:hypothetical protein
MSAKPTTAGDWPQVLTQVEQALAQAVAQIHQREQALLETVTYAQPRAFDWQRFHQQRTALDAGPQRAEQRVTELLGSLGAGEEVLRQWLARAETLRRRLTTKKDKET